MKYRDLDGQFKEITIKTSDTLPVGSVVEYDGSTPPTGWTKVSDHDDNVIVSSEEPTTGEEVWIQRGKNLFDKNNYNLVNGLVDDTSLILNKNDRGRNVYLKVKPNTTYTIRKEIAVSELAATSFVNEPIIGGIATQWIGGFGKKQITITTGQNDNYLCVYVYYDTVSIGTFEEVLNSLEIEEGTSITPKKIHTKTDNGYEEFYNEEEREVYSTGETRIGTWVDGKPLYRQIFTRALNNEDSALIANIDNIDFITVTDKSTTMFEDTSYSYYVPVSTYETSTNFSKFYVSKNKKTNKADIRWVGNYTTGKVIAVVEYTKTTD